MGEPVPSLTVDLLNIEWWQGVIGLIVLLGLSPAPWILGLALGRIQFSGPSQRAYDERVADLKAAHARELETTTKTATDAIAETVRHHNDLTAVQAARYAELERSRDYYRTARLAEADRADRATDQLVEVVEIAKASAQALHALDEAVKGPSS